MRNIQKAVEDYRKINEKRPGGSGGITAYDAVQIRDAAAQKSGGVDILETIFQALEAGYSIGYRAAQRDARKKRACSSLSGNTPE